MAARELPRLVRWALCVLVAALPSVVFGQSPFENTPKRWGFISATSAIALGDIDGDGDLDLICGNSGQSPYVYRNSGGVFEGRPAWSRGRADNTTSVVLGDTDGDGDLDLVCGNSGQSPTAYRNTGEGNFDADPWMGGRADYTSSVALGDVDGDGDLDLVCGNSGQSATVYRNTGGIFENEPIWSEGRPDNTSSVALGDVDGDGDLDLVCGNSGQSPTVYRNSAGTFEATPIGPTGHPSQTYCVALGDTDDDGDLDLMCGNLGESPTLYRSTGGTFEDVPVWSTGGASATYSVALGDIDGDGDLDLVCGNNFQSLAFYRNIGNMFFDNASSWSTGRPENTRSVALGDVDADGDLDLVRGNGAQSPTLYLNTGSGSTRGAIFEDAPVWSAARAADTRSVALGDVDGDGDLDLVCGNGDQGSMLYRNTGGTFADEPAWSTGRRDQTYSVALGDIDNDGDLDLVCGNNFQSPVLYRNTGGVFEPVPVWSSGRPNATFDIALGDVDGDGDLDLVCGNFGGSPTLYRNTDGTFEDDPAWSTGRADPTISVALGDVDGDGDLDLVCGNVRRSPALYRNTGGTFGDVPVWSAGRSDDTSSIELGDVDGDGDLDLVCGNTGQPATLYRNTGGMFEDAPAWSAENPGDTSSMALGDVDRDGDLDVVCGNAGAGPALYLARLSAAFRGDPAAPRNVLPNNDAWLSSARVARATWRTYRVQLMALDLESDPVWIVGEYQFRGESVWHRVTFEGGAARVGPLVTTPTGAAHECTWDVASIGFDLRPVTLRLRAASNPGRVGVPQHIATFLLDCGRIPRGQVNAGPAMSFPAVTVGSTTSSLLRILNSGTDSLTITRIEVPERVVVVATLPFVLGPREHRDLPAGFHPVASGVSPGSIAIESLDPLHPTMILPVHVDIRALAVRVTAVVVPPVPLGEAIRVQATPRDSLAEIESVELHSRPRGAGAFGVSPMSRVGSGWVGTIPGVHVREGGVEYYVAVKNGDVTLLDPVSGPQAPRSLDVRPPVALTVQAQPTAGSGFVLGREIPVLVGLPVGADFVRGQLHYLRVGEPTARPESLVAGALPNLLVGTIPAEAVTARGLEYWVEVQTQTAALRYPAAPASTVALRTSISNLAEQSPTPGGRYRLLSVPVDFGSDFTGTLETLLGDQLESYGDPTRWKAFRYLQNRNVELVARASLPPGDTRFRPEPGRAFWLITRDEHRIDTYPGVGLSTTPTDPRGYPIVLETGWNQFGNPFTFPVRWSDVVMSDSVQVRDLMAFDPHKGNYIGEWADERPATLAPFEGYFVRNWSGVQQTIWIPAIDAAASGVTVADVSSGAPQAAIKGWRLQLHARTDESEDSGNWLGVDDRASNEVDVLDRGEPPPVPGTWVQLQFMNTGWGTDSGGYSGDIRSPTADGHVWDVEVRSQSHAEDVGIDFLPIGLLPAGLAVRLLDCEQQSFVDLLTPGAGTGTNGETGSAGSYRVISFGPDRPYRLKVLAGTAEFVSRAGSELGAVPAQLELAQNAPNPFNASTRIRFGLPVSAQVTLAIYNVRGELVRTLLQNELRHAGYHSVIWDATTRQGASVSSGVYWCRVTAGGAAVTKRLVLLK